MALPLANNADGGADTVGVTAGNSGGTSGDAFDVVNVGASQTITYDATVSMAGLSIKNTLAAAGSYVSWTTSLGTLSIGQSIGGRVYFQFSNAPTAGWQFFRILGGGSLQCAVSLSAAAQLRMNNSAGTALTTGTTVLSTATWYRVEWDLTGVGSTSGGYTVNLYSGDSTSVVDSITGSGAGFGTVAPDTVRIGQAAASFASGTTLNFDDMLVNAGGMPGPARTTARTAMAGAFDPELNYLGWFG